jgi:hypothetical protein
MVLKFSQQMKHAQRTEKYIRVGFYWRFHMMFLLSGCCVMDSKSSTASVNISLNSGSERKLTQLIVEDDRK